MESLIPRPGCLIKDVNAINACLYRWNHTLGPQNNFQDGYTFINLFLGLHLILSWPFRLLEPLISRLEYLIKDTNAISDSYLCIGERRQVIVPRAALLRTGCWAPPVNPSWWSRSAARSAPPRLIPRYLPRISPRGNPLQVNDTQGNSPKEPLAAGLHPTSHLESCGQHHRSHFTSPADT